jgi:hypothetical protein
MTPTLALLALAFALTLVATRRFFRAGGLALGSLNGRPAVRISDPPDFLVASRPGCR